MNKLPILYVDHREDKVYIDNIKFYAENIFDVRVIYLGVGDYLCGNCIIEHKTTNDFLRSVFQWTDI